MSEITIGYEWDCRRSIASLVEATASTAYPSNSRHVTMVVRTDGSSSTINSFCIGSNVSFQYHGKARALSRLAGDFHPPAMAGHDLFHDGKSDAGSHFSGRFGALGPIEFLENT